MSTPTDAIKATIAEVEAALNAGDSDGYVAAMAPDVIVVPPGERAVAGKDAVREWIDTFFSEFDTDLTLAVGRVMVAGDEAAAPGTFAMTLKPRQGGGERMHFSGHSASLFREVEPGEWKYTYTIWTFDPPL